MEARIMTQHAGQQYIPAAVDEIRWETQRKGAPGKLSYKLYMDETLKIEEGDPVRLTVDGSDIASGYVFTKSRSGGVWLNRESGAGERYGEPIVSVTAYDQMRYLKNKDTYNFQKAKASDIISMVATDYGIRLGSIADTGYTIGARVEENTTLLDMMQNALDITTTNTRRLFVLYDDCGRLTLRNSADMQIGIIIDAETAETFDYESSIDKDVYNRIKLVYEDKDGGKRTVYTAQDASTAAQWGTLQHFEKLSDNQGAQNKANALLALHNRKKRTLRISGALGDLRVRAGCYVVVRLNLGDVSVNNLMMVERCTHRFTENEHKMDLEVSGGDFTA